jgi:lipopolysaccharide export system permease protein
MAALIKRYVLRETVQTWFVVTIVLLLILVTNQFAQVLGDAAAHRLPREQLFQVMGLTSLQYLTILVPIGLFLSILLALGRLYRDSEMYALMACGIGPGQLYRPLLGFSAVLAVALAWLALEIAPAAVREVMLIARQARERADLSVMEAGRFMNFGQADAVVYAEEVFPDGRLANVFVQRRDGSNVEVIIAAEAQQQDTADPNVKMLTFTSGRRYEGEPGSPRFRIVEFAEHGVPFSLPDEVPASDEPEARPLADLAGSAEPADVAELQWRLSIPLMALVLTVMAVPLSRSSPRQGRYAGLGAGILIYISYANLLGASRVWLERGQLPAFIGMWWVHALFFLGALGLLGYRYGGWRIRLPGRNGG